MTPDEFRRLGHTWVDWVADYRARVETFPVMSPAHPGEVRRAFAEHPPERGQSLDALLPQLEKHVLPGITHWSHPAFFAYFPCVTSGSAVLADLVISGLGVQAMSWQTSPAATELEEVTMDWVRQMVGLPAVFEGAIQDTASTGNLIALLCARERATEFSQERGGFQNATSRLTVYFSEEAHSSVEKGALLAGFGRDNLRRIPSDPLTHAILPNRLAERVAADVAAGLHPCAIVAGTGTTATTAFDDVGALAELAAAHGAWLHVDAAMAGVAMVLPQMRELWKGVEHADSVVLDPHKWMGTGVDCSAYFVRDPALLTRVMSMTPSYLRTSQDGQVKNLRDWGIALGRRFRALKLWFLFHEIGVEGLRQRVQRDLENAQWLAKQVDAASTWKRLAPVLLQTVCIQHRPLGLDASRVAAHNLGIAQRLNASGKAYVTPAVVKGEQLIRVSIGALTTERKHVEELWALLQQCAIENPAHD
ncbi:MAG: pyridoxal phosphate-dependent decarboxylase family protein [Myxococcaceae bacterium]